jgi:hypothetical protein
VLSGTVGASARVEGHAVVLGGTVSAGTVNGLFDRRLGDDGQRRHRERGLALFTRWFEHPQSISGTAQLLGDIEYRGANQIETSGSFCGFVDDTISSNCTGTDVTAAPPYSWRD